MMTEQPITNEEYVTASFSSALLMAAFVVENDDAWNMFVKFMYETAGMVIPENGREAADDSIETVDMVRQSICRHHGLDPGYLYPRRYSDGGG